jgi:electron transport complex protein RnfC
MNAPGRYNPQPPRPAWGIRPPPRKIESTRLPILEAPVPERVVIPIRQCLGMSARALVSPGEHVTTGQPIAQSFIDDEAATGPQIHASISGQVLAVENRPVPGPETGAEPCVIIESDGRDEHYTGYPASGDPMQLDPDDICTRVAEAGIVGLGGALFSTAAKLSTDRDIYALILNGAECEPYITCDEMLQREQAEKILRGTRIMMRALKTSLAIIAVESDMPEARVALYEAIEAAGDDNIHLTVVTAKYPAGGERQIIQLVMNEEVPEGENPSALGYVCHNVATAAAVADFFDAGRPLISRIVTLAGGGIETPRNVDARIGTLMSELIESTVGFKGEISHLIMGGPMMGMLLPNADLPVTKATNCLIAAAAGEISPPRPEMPCIRCSECSQVCPALLLPQELLTAARRNDMEALNSLGVTACIECGCCDYVCPSHIPMTVRFIEAKQKLNEYEAGMQNAAEARIRFENRQARLDRQTSRQERDLKTQTDDIADVPTGAIDAVMDRVNARRKPE